MGDKENDGEQVIHTETLPPDLVDEVVGLCLGEVTWMGLGYEGQSAAQRDGLWEESASNFPQFSVQIMALRAVFRDLGARRDGNTPPGSDIVTDHFSGVQNIIAMNVMGAILWARVVSSENRIIPDLVLGQANAMVAELGVGESIYSTGVETITTQQIVGAVMRGELLLER